MRNLNWNDLRFLLALHRSGTYSEAGRQLGVDDTTVSRRIKVLERVTGTTLFLRRPDHSLELTPLGQEIADRAEAMERATDAIAESLGAAEKQVRGTVRLTAVPLVVNRVLIPALPSFLAAHPGLTVELTPDARDLSLTRREADLALRLARPKVGGGDVLAQRIGRLSYAAFYAANLKQQQAESLPWITYDDGMAHLPHARWLAQRAKRATEQASNLRVSDGESALEAAVQGLGKTLAPSIVGAADGRLKAWPLRDGTVPPQREVWLLSHAAQRELTSIRTVIDWLKSIRWA